MKFRVILTLITIAISLSAFTPNCFSDTIDELPKFVVSALDEYKNTNADNFIAALVKGSALENDKNALSQSNIIKQIESFYGKYESSEHIKTVKVSKSTSLIFFVMNYEYGPLFTKATVFKKNNKAFVSNFKFHTEIEMIIPTDVIF